MKIRRPALTTWLLLVALFVAACSSSDSPPATTTTPPPASNVVANAGDDQNVVVGSFITLNGSKSTTTNSNQLSYTWSMTVPVGSTATLSDTTKVNPTFTTDVVGTYECELVVSDGQETSSPDKVTITATAAGTTPPPNPRPVANAGPNRSVSIGKLISLDGSKSSDMIGDPLEFTWIFTGRPPLSTASLMNADKVNPSFTPDVAGLYKIQLVVNDGTSDSAPASVNITASAAPPPTAEAGPPQIVLPNSLVTLDGSQSAGTGLSFQWSLTPPAGVMATLNNPNIAKPTFTPRVHGAYTAQLIVTDSTGAKSAPDTVLITVGPRANAGPAQTVSVGATVPLNGSGSFGASLSYAWAFTAPLVPGSTAAFAPNNTVVNPTFRANAAGTYMIRLTVTDSVGRSDIATTTVTAQAGPTANFTFDPPNPVEVNETVRLTNTSTGSSLAFTWEFTPRPTGSNAQFSPNASATNPTFVADRAGDYRVKLTARTTSTNALPHSLTRTITATSPPPINIRPTAEIKVTTALPANVCSTVELNGTSSFDPDGSVASYLWTLTPPNGSAATLRNGTSSTPEFDADKAGTFNVRLVVSDNLGLKSSEASEEIIATPNVIGKNIYVGTPKIPGILLGGCFDCHKAGNFDQTGKPGFDDLFKNGLIQDLSNPLVTTGKISDRLKGPHTGGIPSPALTVEQIKALRQFLDSTLPNCP